MPVTMATSHPASAPNLLARFCTLSNFEEDKKKKKLSLWQVSTIDNTEQI
jgi:hypothetical protein